MTIIAIASVTSVAASYLQLAMRSEQTCRSRGYSFRFMGQESVKDILRQNKTDYNALALNKKFNSQCNENVFDCCALTVHKLDLPVCTLAKRISQHSIIRRMKRVIDNVFCFISKRRDLNADLMNSFEEILRPMFIKESTIIDLL